MSVTPARHPARSGIAVTERRPLEAVIFDAGGTLVRLDFEWMSEWLATRGLDLPAAWLRRHEVEGRRRYDASRGREPRPGSPPPPLGHSGDTRAYFGGMLEAAGVPGALRERTLEAFDERQSATGLWSRPMEGARTCIDGVGSLGLRTAVVSNSDGRAEQHLRDCGVREGLEFVVDSHVVGFEKPDPRILAIALERLGVAPERALLVGDIRSVDEAVARSAGTFFVLVDPFGDYGAGGLAIRAMADLVPCIRAHFTVPQPESSGRPGAGRA